MYSVPAAHKEISCVFNCTNGKILVFEIFPFSIMAQSVKVFYNNFPFYSSYSCSNVSLPDHSQLPPQSRDLRGEVGSHTSLSSCTASTGSSCLRKTETARLPSGRKRWKRELTSEDKRHKAWICSYL